MIDLLGLLQFLNTWSSAIQAGAAVATVVATIFIIHYAQVTIEEGKKNRRKDMIEKQLEKVYSPLYEILRRARHEKERDLIRKILPPTDYVLEEREFIKAREVLEDFGHYLPRQVRMGLTNAFEKADVEDSGGKRYYRVHLAIISQYDNYIIWTCEELRRELEKLTQV